MMDFLLLSVGIVLGLALVEIHYLRERIKLREELLSSWVQLFRGVK